MQGILTMKRLSRVHISENSQIGCKKKKLVLCTRDLISPNDPNEGIPMPLMHDMLSEDSFRHSI